ncbi:MAG: translation elongation factor Ts [Oscillospiraceae bacterium]|nr:translation elongation factor Ts [Oscillospiraceae bacterium]
MAAFTAKDVADLRARTGVGMMDCKKALAEAEGDMEKAMTLLREKGLATQASKAGRVAAEGLVCAIVENGVGAVVEVNSETDFVAQNQEFKNFVTSAAKTVIASNPADLDALLASKAVGGTGTVEEDLQELFLKIRENMKVRRFERLEGILVPYVHGDGKIGVIVKLDSDIAADNEKLLDCGKNIALQVAAMNALYLDRAAVPPAVIEEEKKIMMAQMEEDPKMKGKPEQVRAKIVDGKIGKYYTENCLVEQSYVKDGELSVSKYVESVAKELGGSIQVIGFVRYEKGEGIEKKQDNFAAEVAGMVNN